jgi:hypothetical protein
MYKVQSTNQAKEKGESFLSPYSSLFDIRRSIFEIGYFSKLRVRRGALKGSHLPRKSKIVIRKSFYSP